MSEERSGGRALSSSMGSSRGSTWRERRQKWREDREHPRGEERSGLGEGSAQTHRTVSGVSAHRQYDDRDRELERLRRLVMDLELEARGQSHERNRNPSKGEIGAKRASADLVCNDPETGHALKSHAGNHGNHVIGGAAHGRMVTMTRDQNRQRNEGTTVSPWTP